MKCKRWRAHICLLGLIAARHVQNVVGFETSATHEAMMGALTRQGYAVQECILTPTQLRVPYSRPR